MSRGELPGRLARNIKTLREARGLTQEQMSRVSGIPRATWGHLESGSANPTLSVLHRVALALQVPIEELTSTPRASCRYYPRDRLPARKQGDATVRKLLPDPVPAPTLTLRACSSRPVKFQYNATLSDALTERDEPA